MRGLFAHISFVLCLGVGALIYRSPIAALGALVFKNETYSHIALIPVVSLFLLATQRHAILAVAERRPSVGCAVCAGGLLLYGMATAFENRLGAAAFRAQDVSNDYLTLCMAGAVAWAIGSFIAVYGTTAFRQARFALLFLVFAIPLPMFLLHGIVTSLQHASAQAADLVFGAIGTPYHRTGMVFELPNVTVEVAEVCSGIRSSLSLFILSVLTGFLFLRTMSRRVLLALAILPITVVKNAFRIATVTLLANYVDMRFLTHHWIHRSGGIPFFAVALAMFIPIVWLLRKSEARAVNRRKAADSKTAIGVRTGLQPPVGTG